MTLTDDQRAAVRTWRRGRNGSIVADLPFNAGSEPLPDGLAEWYGGCHIVCEIKSDPAIDFILAATRAAAEDER